MRSGSQIRPGGDARGYEHVAYCGSGGRTRVPAAATMEVPPPPLGFREVESKAKKKKEDEERKKQTG